MAKENGPSDKLHQRAVDGTKGFQQGITDGKFHGKEHNHDWPKHPEDHKWSSWMANTTGPKATRYRKCIDTMCNAYEVEPQPKG